METFVVRELYSDDEMMSAYPIIKQLRTHLNEDSYLELVKEAKVTEGYRLFALFDRNEIVAVIGFMPMTTLYYGRFIWVCDLVTDKNKRSKGYGEKLLSYLHDWAIQNGYKEIALSSGLQRTDAHRFYEQKMGYDKISYVFKTRL